jgi:hypothetical protein
MKHFKAAGTVKTAAQLKKKNDKKNYYIIEFDFAM